METSPVLLEKTGPIARVILNRPGKLNVFNNNAFDEFRRVISNLQADNEVRVVIVDGGSSKLFSAGLDLTDQSLAEINENGELDTARRAWKLSTLVKRWQSAFSALEECTKPVICCIHGGCIGAGVDLATACDIRLCTKDAFFSVKEAADLGTLQRLPKIIGNQSFVREICFTGRRVGAEEALQQGLVSRVFETREEMISAAMSLSHELCLKSPVALQSSKAILLHSRDHNVADGLSYVATWNAAMLQSEDITKSVTAQLQKQPQQFANL